MTTQTERVEAFLRANPEATAIEILLGCHPWVSNVRARISDLRAQGIDVVCERRSDGKNGYRIVEPSPVQAALFFAER